MILKIVKEGDPVLREQAKAIPKITKRIKKLAKDMLDTMYNANGVGLAAPQVGISERIIVIDVGKGPIVLVNPEIIAAEGKEKDTEGCLSIPGRSEYVTRAAHVEVSALNLDGDTIKVEGSGLLARALQHEIDHLNGILFIDYVKK
ncbi:MAG TPA: peptide deformylase [Bacillota bacterium]|jgi:peptide deformylase|nr:peptide deformylase [Bacillota bacterium]HOL10463.1 peptide deformylase [Bacillota bacterium]HPO98164.1 peptide deformylase [Bacillota bacterium]